MIKVLVLGLHGILGGSETYVNNLIRCFDKEEIRCDFLVVGNDKTPYEDAINEFYNDGYNHFFYCPNLKKEYFKGRKWIKNFYDNHNYDIIYLNATSAANAIYCRYALEKKKIPMITHSHFSNGPWVNHVLYRNYTCKHSVYKLACSKPAAHWMFGKNISEVKYIANGINTERFSFNDSFRNEIRREFDIKNDEIVIGHVGRFSMEKNHKFFLELAKKLPENYIFMCIGEGPCKEEFITRIDEMKLSNRFRILPVKSDVERYYCAMDVFAMPSLYEGLPIVSVEAQCTGLQVVFSDTISKQADLTGKCYFELLNDADLWSNRILNLNIKRFDGRVRIQDSGFSIQDVANDIRKLFYQTIDKKN